MRRIKYKRIFIVFLVIFLIICTVFVVDKRMRTVIYDYSASMGETIMIKTVEQIVSDLFTEENVDYSDLVYLQRDDGGLVTSLQVNATKINYLKSQISVRVAEEIEKGERFTLAIPMGTIIGNEYTVGRGPDIKFKMQITTTIFADFVSDFHSAGINQVLHQIHIRVKMNGSVVIPWFRSSFNAQTDVIAAETVIVGITPDAYTNVIEAGTDATEDIFDFGTH
ncbi:MAG: sporulation protein YunB [Acutalibacteraceae bacterium]|nr:sporulation protein YunB [Acutalibacteraceae bacterium]